MFNKKSKEEKRIRSKVLIDFLTGEKMDKAPLRVEKSDKEPSVKYAIYTRKVDKDGVEFLEEVK